MVRLRRVTPGSKGWQRRRVGKGFRYTDESGVALPADEVERIKSLAIPPAWEDVWICPQANGHLQATGIDAKGRKQYLYHPDWRTRRDQQKFSFGLTTLERRHVRRKGDNLVFSFVGKSGVQRTIEIDDALSIASVDRMRRRRSRDPRLMAYQESGRWTSLDAAQVNDYLRESTGGDMTAKDFRTWHATVLAAVALAESDEPGDTAASRKRAVRKAMVEVSEYLGNTPAIAKASYVDPRVIDLFEGGTTIASAVRRSYRSPEEKQAAMEKAVLKLLASS